MANHNQGYVHGSSSEDEDQDKKSVASEYVYVQKVEEKKSWDRFSQTLDEASSASEKHTDFIKKAAVGLKLLSILLTFGIVLTAGVVAKGATFFMVAQMSTDFDHGNNLIGCARGNSDPVYIGHGVVEPVAWHW